MTTQRRSEHNYIQIEMDAPFFNEFNQVPWTDSDLKRIAYQYAEELVRMTDADTYPIEDTVAEWSLQDGYLVYACEAQTIRIGRGYHGYGNTDNGDAIWWVDFSDILCPGAGQPVHGWTYKAHFPGIFTYHWVNWLYNQWFA